MDSLNHEDYMTLYSLRSCDAYAAVMPTQLLQEYSRRVEKRLRQHVPFTNSHKHFYNYSMCDNPLLTNALLPLYYNYIFVTS